MDFYTQVHRVIRENKPSKSYVEGHRHPFFQCIFGLSGAAQVVIDGTEAIPLEKNGLLIISPDTEHTVLTMEGFGSIEIMFSCTDRLQRMLGEERAMQIDASFSVRALMCEIVSEAAKADFYAQEIVNTQVSRLLFMLLRDQKKRGRLIGNVSQEVYHEGWENLPEYIRKSPVREALLYIEANLDKRISIAELSELCGYEKNYFSCVFQRYMNEPPSLYIQNRKHNVAKELLITSDATITEIAERLGYQSVHYFSRVFKALEGVSPTEYSNRLMQALAVNLSDDAQYPPTGTFEYRIRKLSDCDDKSILERFAQWESHPPTRPR